MLRSDHYIPFMSTLMMSHSLVIDKFNIWIDRQIRHLPDLILQSLLPHDDRYIQCMNISNQSTNPIYAWSKSVYVVNPE